jgi:hypothetical protein
MSQFTNVNHQDTPLHQLPRLLYIGDVPITNTFAGAALLYRLLAFYPSDKLVIICSVTPGMKTLPGVKYYHWGARFPRLLQTRFASVYCLWHFWRHKQIPSLITKVADSFQPEAVLSVSHVNAWLSAWRLSVARSISFHLIAHDDYAFTQLLPKIARPWAERRFAEAYRGASSRFCISPAMAEIYRQRYGEPAEVMYPTRNLTTSSYDQVACRTTRETTSLTFAYAGSIHGDSTFSQIISFARIVGELGHRLLIFTPQYIDLAARANAASVLLDARAPLPVEELFDRLRKEADCLVVVQSHDAERAEISTLFPTKFADYSAMGLPIFVWAPVYSALVDFIKEYADCAEVVTDANIDAVKLGIMRVAASPERRRQLAENAMQIGKNCFSPEMAWALFKAALLRTRLKSVIGKPDSL